MDVSMNQSAQVQMTIVGDQRPPDSMLSCPIKEEDLIEREMATYRFVLEDVPISRFNNPEDAQDDDEMMEEGQQQNQYRTELQLVIQYYPEVRYQCLEEIYQELQQQQMTQGTAFQMPPQYVQVINSSQRLRNLRDSDQANLICYDCKSNLADHASVTFAIFICGECAEQHLAIQGKKSSYIKALFKNSHVADCKWDEFLLRHMEFGGNYQFRKFMLYYKLRCKETFKRYCHKAARWYSLNLRAKVEGHQLPIKPPSRGFTKEEIAYFISKGLDPELFENEEKFGEQTQIDTTQSTGSSRVSSLVQ